MKSDPSSDQFKIREYQFWDLYLHEQQYPYIGRCYAWALRDDALRPTDMNVPERNELFDTIVPAWESAITKLFRMDWPNIAILGNTTAHLHAHLIPRYNYPVSFRGIAFVDPQPKNAPWPIE